MKKFLIVCLLSLVPALTPAPALAQAPGGTLVPIAIGVVVGAAVLPVALPWAFGVAAPYVSAGLIGGLSGYLTAR
ncbi:MAG: hypothetical protein ACT4P2_16965 [Pseudomonadota bacterium]